MADPGLYPQSSLEQLTDLNIRGTVQTEDKYDPNLYRDKEAAVFENGLQEVAEEVLEESRADESLAKKKVTFDLGQQADVDVTANFDFKDSTTMQ
jgi:hypothetical protein